MAAFIPARWFTPASRPSVRLCVWHDMEAPEKNTTAEAVARYFRDLGPKVKASAHINADADSVVECVRADDVAYAAPGANHDGYQIELAGYARQSAGEWLDAFSKATIDQAVGWIVHHPMTTKVPDRWLTDAQLRDGRTSGHVTHAQVSRVFKKSNHTDPGPNFPKQYVMDRIAVHRGGAIPPPPSHPPMPPQEIDMAQLPVLSRQLGSRGPHVTLAQAALVHVHSHDLSQEGGIDGVFGPGFERELVSFQAARGLPANGIIDGDDWHWLLGAR